MSIRSLSVPSLVEVGTNEVILECDFAYEHAERDQLEIKWYFDDAASPFVQWVPARMLRPQLIDKERFGEFLDLKYAADDTGADPFTRHRALKLRRPSLALSGNYACKVSTLLGEDVGRKHMQIYCE